jgi:hypothetical protein
LNSLINGNVADTHADYVGVIRVAKPDNRIEEWKSLRDELASKQAFCERIVLTTVGANLAIYAYAMRDPITVNSIPALMLPPFLGSIAYYWLLTHIHSGRRIAYHLRCDLEHALGFKWEETVEGLRAEPVDNEDDQNDVSQGDGSPNAPSKKKSKPSTTIGAQISRLTKLAPYALILVAFYVVSLLAALWCIWVSEVMPDLWASWSVTAGTVVVLVAMATCAYRYYFSAKFEEIEQIRKRDCKDHPGATGR